MDKKTVIERVKRYSDLVRKNFPVKKVILYGSYARGTQKTHSDIDVAVVLDHVEGDFLTAETRHLRPFVNSPTFVMTTTSKGQ